MRSHMNRSHIAPLEVEEISQYKTLRLHRRDRCGMKNSVTNSTRNIYKEHGARLRFFTVTHVRYTHTHMHRQPCVVRVGPEQRTSIIRGEAET